VQIRQLCRSVRCTVQFVVQIISLYRSVRTSKGRIQKQRFTDDRNFPNFFTYPDIPFAKLQNAAPNICDILKYNCNFVFKFWIQISATLSCRSTILLQKCQFIKHYLLTRRCIKPFVNLCNAIRSAIIRDIMRIDLQCEFLLIGKKWSWFSTRKVTGN